MEIVEIIKEIEREMKSGKLSEKRFTCAHCGETWIEMVGLIIGHREGEEDYCLHVGLESENCQICRHRPLECPACNSRDVYEVAFTRKTPGNFSPNFKALKIITKNP